MATGGGRDSARARSPLAIEGAGATAAAISAFFQLK